MALPAYTPRPSRRELAGELGAVIADLPLFLTAPLYRRLHLRWGASACEVHAALPGDDLVPRAQYRTTRAITIDAPPQAVWPWLVQVGCLRAGFYSDDLLDNLGHPSAREILPALQTLQVGQWVPMSPLDPTEVTAFKVHSFRTDQWLLWSKPDSSWAWVLMELPGRRTRLVTRVRTRYDWSQPAAALFGVLLMEFGDFAMMRRMLRGIAARAGQVVVPVTPRRPLAVLAFSQLAATSVRRQACAVLAPRLTETGRRHE